MSAPGFFSGNHQKKLATLIARFSQYATGIQRKMVCCARWQYAFTRQLFFRTSREENHSATSGDNTATQPGTRARHLAGDRFPSGLAADILGKH
ncbi:hypothetical protein AB4I99_13145 [Citrobacter murliniae]